VFKNVSLEERRYNKIDHINGEQREGDKIRRRLRERKEVDKG
jgi:hypothetical protein